MHVQLTTRSVLPRMDITTESAKFLLTQGILGFTTLILGLAVVFLYRDNRAIRAQTDQIVRDERLKSAAEMADVRKVEAEVRKALNDCQEARINELRMATLAIAKSEATLDQALAFVHGSVKA